MKRTPLPALTLFAAALLHCSPPVQGQETIGPWKKGDLFAVPNHHPSDQINVSGVDSITYEGLNYKGRPSRFYAYYAMPSGEKPGPGIAPMTTPAGRTFQRNAA